MTLVTSRHYNAGDGLVDQRSCVSEQSERSMSENNRVLAIGAHPDDVEFCCTGTLSRLKKKGAEVVIATMAPGDCGTTQYSAREISRIRKGEAAKSASMLGAEYVCLEERDLSIDCDTVTRRKVTGLVRSVDPAIVFTHFLVDYMVDHEATGRLVRDACFGAGVPNFGTPGNESHTETIPHLYYFPPSGCIDNVGNPIEPHFVVDVSDEVEQKKGMLACHASQREWLLRHHGMDEYIESMLRRGAEMGKRIGVEHGEGFLQHRCQPYPTDNTIAERLGIASDSS